MDTSNIFLARLDEGDDYDRPYNAEYEAKRIAQYEASKKRVIAAVINQPELLPGGIAGARFNNRIIILHFVIEQYGLDFKSSWEYATRVIYQTENQYYKCLDTSGAVIDDIKTARRVENRNEVRYENE